MSHFPILSSRTVICERFEQSLSISLWTFSKKNSLRILPDFQKILLARYFHYSFIVGCNGRRGTAASNFVDHKKFLKVSSTLLWNKALLSCICLKNPNGSLLGALTTFCYIAIGLLQHAYLTPEWIHACSGNSSPLLSKLHSFQVSPNHAWWWFSFPWLSNSLKWFSQHDSRCYISICISYSRHRFSLCLRGHCCLFNYTPAILWLTLTSDQIGTNGIVIIWEIYRFPLPLRCVLHSSVLPFLSGLCSQHPSSSCNIYTLLLVWSSTNVQQTVMDWCNSFPMKYSAVALAPKYHTPTLFIVINAHVYCQVRITD